MQRLARSIWVAWLLVALMAPSAAAQSTDKTVSVQYMALLSRRFDEQKKFWMDLLGGTPGWIVPPGQKSAFFLAFPNFMVEIVAGEGSGGTAGTTFDHVMFQVRDLKAVVGKLRAAGYSEVTTPERRRREPSPAATLIAGPEDVLVGFVENSRLHVPLALHHVHLAAPPGRVREMAEWYVAVVGAKAGRRGQDYESLDLPGAPDVLVFSESSTPVVGMTGRVVRHMGFHIPNMRALYQRMAKSVNFARPVAEFVPGMWYSFATDPMGTVMGLVEFLPGVFFPDPASSTITEEESRRP